MENNRITASAFGAACGTLLIAILLAQLGLYSKWIGWILGCSFFACFLAVIHQAVREQLVWCKQNTGKTDYGLRISGGVLAYIICPSLACVLFIKPSENLLGNHDQGMYLATALNIQRTGNPSIELPSLRTFEPSVRKSWLQNMPVQFGRQSGTSARYWSLATGFVLKDQAKLDGPAIPHFPPGFPVLCAAFFDLGNWELTKLINTLLILSSGFWIAILIGNWAGYGYSLLVVPFYIFNPLVLWAANHLYAEPLVLFLWLGFVWSFHQCDRIPWLSGTAVSSAAAVGCLTKVDALPMVALVAAMLIVCRENKPWRMSLFLSAVVGFSISAVSIFLHNSHYIRDTVVPILSDKNILIQGGSALLAAALIFAYRRKVFQILSEKKSIIYVTAPIFILCTLAFFYFFRAADGAKDTYYFEPLGKEILSYRELTLQRLDWYIPYGGFWPLVVGICLSIHQIVTRSSRMFFLLGIVSVVFLAYDIRCNPLQPYCMRRFLPYAIPALACGAAYSAQFVKSKTRHWALLVAGMAAIYFDGSIAMDRSLFRSAEYDGLWSNLKRVSQVVPDDAIIVISSRSPLCPLAIPLRCIFGKDTFILHFDKNDPKTISEIRASFLQLLENKRRVVILDTSETFVFNTGLKPRLILATKWYTENQPGSYSDIGAASKMTSWRCVLSELTQSPIVKHPLPIVH